MTRRALVGARLRARRKTLGLTQAGLAATIGISPSYLNLIEGDRRNIGGALLQRIASALGLSLEHVGGVAERRLADALAEIAIDPLVASLRLDAASAADLVSRNSPWAHALVSLHRAYLDRSEAAASLADRLNHDPALSAAVHALLTQVSAIRSAAEILEGEGELELAQRQHFVSNIASDSRRLSDGARMLASFFSPEQAATRSRTAVEEVDDFVVRHDNHFSMLEDIADTLRADFGLENNQLSEAALLGYLQSRGIAAHAGSGTSARADGPAATRRFALARAVAAHAARDAIASVLRDSPVALSARATERVEVLLSAYVAGAMLMPYTPFLAGAVRWRYDIDRLCGHFDASFEQVCHRLVTLRRPDAQGIRFGFMRSDAAGHLSKRFTLPRLPMPVYGNACPLWALFAAFQSPGTLVRQLVEFPAGDRYLMLARAVEKGQASWGQPRRNTSVMLMCEAVFADRMVYGDGLDVGPQSAVCVPVGQTCRVCVRTDCAARQEDAILAPLS